MIDRITDTTLNRSSRSKDFVIRKRYPTLLQLFIIFLSVVLIGMSVVLASADKMAMISILFILGGATSWYVTALIQRNRDQLLATEFQNALFASALGMNHKFCFIIRRDGNIIYQDRSFQDMFPDFIRQPSRTIDALLDHGKVPVAEKDTIFKAIERGEYQKVVFDIRGSDGSFQKIVMSMEPILRPSGFILMRGREFVESRSSDDRYSGDATLFSRTTMSLFSGVMDTMNMGVYMASPQGQIVYINPTLAKWLEYTPYDITAGAISLQNMMHSTVGKTDIFTPQTFEGELLLQRKTGGLVKCYVNQTAITDERGHAVGCTGLVQHLTEHSPDSKKKAW